MRLKDSSIDALGRTSFKTHGIVSPTTKADRRTVILGRYEMKVNRILLGAWIAVCHVKHWNKSSWPGILMTGISTRRAKHEAALASPQANEIGSEDYLRNHAGRRGVDRPSRWT